jgi:hypothetical protein
VTAPRGKGGRFQKRAPRATFAAGAVRVLDGSGGYGLAVAACAACDRREVVGGVRDGDAVPACASCGGPRSDATPAPAAPLA